MPRAAPYRVTWDPERGAYELHDTSSQQALPVVPGSREWYDWLRSVSSFTFGGQHAQLTVRQESRSGGSAYWYAYRRTGVKTTKKYLGRTSDLSLAHLEEVDLQLASHFAIRSEQEPPLLDPTQVTAQALSKTLTPVPSRASEGTKDRVGQRLGNYRLTRWLGKGAFADVYLGEHIYLNNQVAIKVLHTQVDTHATKDFLTEARHLSHLMHLHIIRVFDFGIEHQTPYLVMDYAPYGNLRELHPPGTTVPLLTVVSYTSAIASALQFAHDQHLLHRDLKPENVLVGPKHEVLLSDFGLALLTAGSETIQVQQGSSTLDYMAPEQIRGQISPASDQYALAVMVYEWLSGHLPFSDSAPSLANEHRSLSLASLSELDPDISSSVEEVVYRALSKDPQRRFVDVLSFAAAFEEAAQASSHLPSIDTELLVNSRHVRYTNLPHPLTPLFGREEVQKAVRTRLARPRVRMLTLTGAPGVGKTRLAVALASDVLEEFTHGVCFVPLAPISDPDLVISAIAHAFGLQEYGKRPLFEYLSAFLRTKQLLLLLDNFEQVLPAAPLLSDLLMACPKLKILVTSRAVLHLEGEYVYKVPPLAVPDLQHLPAQDTLSQVASVALFADQAQAKQSDFELTGDNAATIAEICVLLDGLPLALVLAAARIKVLSPRTLLARLSQGFEVLADGRRDAPAHQQTLRATITWSYNLLEAREQSLFRSFCVFVGGCTLEAAEAVGTTASENVTPILDVISSLIDNSLLVQREQEAGKPRLHMLATMREYGLEALAACGELERAHNAHAAYYLALAERTEPALVGAEQGSWADQLERDHKNIRAALQWLLEQGKIEEVLRLATALQQFWLQRGYLSEGRRFLEQALDAGRLDLVSISPQVRASALYAAGYLAFWQNDPGQAIVLLEESERLSRQLEDKRGIALALTYLGAIIHNRGEVAAAATIHEEALRLCKEVGAKSELAELIAMLGVVPLFHGEYTQAREILEEGLALCKEVGNVWLTATFLYFLGWIAYEQGEYTHARLLTEESLAHHRTLGKPIFFLETLITYAYELIALGDELTARTLLEEALSLSRELESQDDSARTLCGLGYLALRQGDLVQARTHYEESITTLQGRWIVPRLKWALASSLEGLGEIASAVGQVAWTVRLFAAANAVRSAHGYYSPLAMKQPFYDQTVAAVRAQLGENAFTALWAEGHQLTPLEALTAEARAPITMSGPRAVSTSTLSPLATVPGGLTAREVEVLRLVAIGLSKNQIAEQLVLSPNTVNVHIQSIYGKLGINSRSAATRYAIEHHLA
jgi:predicted ATPase/DNA-binding NarL/FixJ family response regulator/tRNA A-37 threonylcarbamoyl transferase component Bud32